MKSVLAKICLHTKKTICSLKKYHKCNFCDKAFKRQGFEYYMIANWVIRLTH